MSITAPAGTDGSGSGKAGGFTRRLFLAALAVAPAILAIPSSLRAFFLRTFPVRTVERDTFAFDAGTGTIYWKETKSREPFALLLDGLVEKPIRLSYAELQAMPQVSQISDFHCVEGWSIQDVEWKGIRFQELLKKVKLTDGVAYVTFHSLGSTGSQPFGQDHYIESFAIKDLVDPKKECLLAFGQDGKPLTHDHGAPCRVIAPFDLAYKNIKFVCRMEFSQYQKAGWWTLVEPMYPVNAPVPLERLRKR
ncbi:MAG TPA: molybdopterin-dependent oxidoreductase [Syntrophorhabdaceae bacterium]|jgi:hypothetical protein